MLAVSRSTDLAALATLAESARDYAERARSAATQKAYTRDWQAFRAWCEAHGATALPAPAEVVALYVADLASSRAVATIERALVAIGQAHKAAGHASPTSTAPVQAVRRGIRRTLGVAQRQKAPLLVEQLRLVLSGIADDLAGLRDRALLLAGFATSLRRAELVALDVDDCTFRPEGLTVLVRRSKTDQEGAGRVVGVPLGQHAETCPVRALRAWLAAVARSSGPVFVSVSRWGALGGRLDGRDVARIVQRRTRAVGLEADFAGHSLRAGLVTSAKRAGKSTRSIQRQTAHKSEAMVARYDRDGDVFRDNAAEGLGL